MCNHVLNARRYPAAFSTSMHAATYVRSKPVFASKRFPFPSPESRMTSMLRFSRTSRCFRAAAKWFRQVGS